MKQCVCAVMDRAVLAYQQPFFAPTTGAAVRAFRDEVLRDGSELGKHPEDYELHQVAVWDQESGEFTSIVGAPVTLIRGKECAE